MTPLEKLVLLQSSCTYVWKDILRRPGFYTVLQYTFSKKLTVLVEEPLSLCLME